MTRIIESLKQAVRYAQGDKRAARSTLFLEVPTRSETRLKQLVIDTDAEDIKEVVQNALQLYEGLVAQIKAGGTVIIRQADGTEIEALGGDDE
jgi:hypothetical protein